VDTDSDFLPIPDPGVKKALDPGSATMPQAPCRKELFRTVFFEFHVLLHLAPHHGAAGSRRWQLAYLRIRIRIKKKVTVPYFLTRKHVLNKEKRYGTVLFNKKTRPE
jgi:hypothetical protein